MKNKSRLHTNAVVSALLLVGASTQSRAVEMFTDAAPDLDGKPALMVLASPQEGHQRVIYFDPESGLTLGYDQVQDITGVGTVGSVVRFSDYRDVGGVQLPFKVTTIFPTPVLGTVIYQVEKVETGVKLDEDPFSIK